MHIVTITGRILIAGYESWHFAIHSCLYRIGYLSEILCLSLLFIALLAWPVCCCLLGGLTVVCWMVLQSWLWLERFLSVLRCLLTGVPLLVTHMYNCDTGVRVHTGKLWYTVCEWHKYNYNIWHIVRILVSPGTVFVCETLIELPLFSDKLHQRSPAALPFQQGTAVMGSRSMVCRVSLPKPSLIGVFDCIRFLLERSQFIATVQCVKIIITTLGFWHLLAFYLNCPCCATVQCVKSKVVRDFTWTVAILRQIVEEN